MPAQTDAKQWGGTLGGFSWPLLIGAASCSALYVMILQGPLHSPFLMRYFASHPVQYFICGLFCVGLAALLIKGVDLARQAHALPRIHLRPSSTGDPRTASEESLAQLNTLPPAILGTYLAGRLTNSLRYVGRKGSPEGLDIELKHFSKLDTENQKGDYAFARVVVKTLPVLGLLGTLVGIAGAIGRLDPRLFTTDMPAAMRSLLGGLYVAFDPTALALVMSVILVFVMFFEDKFETKILSKVDQIVGDWMAEWFPDDNGRSQGYIRAVERMSSAVVKTTETLIKQQTEQWKAAMDETNIQLGSVAQATGEQIRAALTESLDGSLKNHAERLARFEFEADQQMRARWDQWQSALAENVKVVRDQQEECTKQTEILSKIVAATGEIATLETSLNRNLHALATHRNFEDTVLSLSAAIQLLSTRMSITADSPAAVDLRGTSQGRAA